MTNNRLIICFSAVAQSNGIWLLPTVFVALVKICFHRLMDFYFNSSHVFTSLAARYTTFPTHFYLIKHLFQGYILALENLLMNNTLNIDS